MGFSNDLRYSEIGLRAANGPDKQDERPVAPAEGKQVSKQQCSEWEGLWVVRARCSRNSAIWRAARSRPAAAAVVRRPIERAPGACLNHFPTVEFSWHVKIAELQPVPTRKGGWMRRCIAATDLGALTRRQKMNHAGHLICIKLCSTQR